jgi:hypothetical protein
LIGQDLSDIVRCKLASPLLTLFNFQRDAKPVDMRNHQDIYCIKAISQIFSREIFPAKFLLYLQLLQFHASSSATLYVMDTRPGPRKATTLNVSFGELEDVPSWRQRRGVQRMISAQSARRIEVDLLPQSRTGG